MCVIDELSCSYWFIEKLFFWVKCRMTVVSSIMTVSVLPVVDIKFVIYYMTNLISGRRTLSSLSASKLVSLLS